MMYVLCCWKGRLWPAKVLSRSWTLPKYKRRRVLSLQVQILSEDQKLRVKGKDARALNKLEIEALATSARAWHGKEYHSVEGGTCWLTSTELWQSFCDPGRPIGCLGGTSSLHNHSQRSRCQHRNWP
uniref:PWWP domain-containing protein n=1 Tax=Urocitellus parryii TaxID=9999 RepID=A0A8D2KKA2_UROPR